VPYCVGKPTVIWMEGHRAFFHNITAVSFTVDSFFCGGFGEAVA